MALSTWSRSSRVRGENRSFQTFETVTRVNARKNRAGANDDLPSQRARGLEARLRSWHDRLAANDEAQKQAVRHEILLWTSATGSCPEPVIDAVVGASAALKDGDVEEARWLLSLAEQRLRQAGRS
jgi:hypothetical protein